MNYYARNLGDYAAAAGHLSALEHGIYNLLIDWYYANESPIPADRAHRIARSYPADVDPILLEFFQRDGEVWRHKRIDREIDAYREKSGKAKAAANRRWADANAEDKSCERNADAMPTHSEGNANQEPITNNQELTPPTPPAGGAVKFDPLDCPAEINRDAWADWVNHRKARRKPISERAAREQWALLSSLTPAQQGDCIAESIRNDWTGLFPKKFEVIRGTGQSSSRPDNSAAGRVRANVQRELAELAAARERREAVVVDVEPVRAQVGQFVRG